MFDRIAGRYDLLNRINSLGLDQRWRNRAVRALEILPGHRVLDLATGTGDLAISIAQRHREASVTALDPSSKMLDVARTKIIRSFRPLNIELRLGDAQALPFSDASFDRASIAFGIRNFPDRAKALRELARVLRPGGRLVILELSTPDSGILAPFARFHVSTIVPRVGALLSGEREYKHLEDSIAAFPPPEEFARLIESTGLEMERLERLTFGACAMYVARNGALE
jgi:demethylmenaquinone methyltransferase/2-methoxy-6-polyprenyl-1,4-benzoquinol methylase